MSEDDEDEYNADKDSDDEEDHKVAKHVKGGLRSGHKKGKHAKAV